MPNRTIKLIGKAYSTSGNVTITVNWNNSQVYNNTIATASSSIPAQVNPDDCAEVCSWTFTTDTTGSIPLSIAVSGGDFAFHRLDSNYTGKEFAEDGVTVTTAPENFWSDMNYNDASSDGKDNVNFTGNVDGEAPFRDLVTYPEAADGEWVYNITNGVTFSCDYVVDPDLTVTS